MTIAQLCEHFDQRELTRENTWRSYSTKKTYGVYLKRWVIPYWGKYELSAIRTIQVESWLRRLPLAKSSCTKIRNVMSVLFNHACRYEFFDRNPICLVRQSAKRRTAPSVLTPAEIKALTEGLALRERTLVLIAASTGLRQSELFGLRWGDIDFAQGCMNVTRSIVYGVVGPCKTESSQKPVPFHPLLADALSRGGENNALTRSRTTGFLPASATGDGSHTGDRQFCATMFGRLPKRLESKSASDGIPSVTPIRLCCGASEQSSR